MAKKKKAPEPAPEPEKTGQRRPCFSCDGTGNMCDECGESEAVCECEEEDKQTSPCSECNGHGIAWNDLTDAEKSP
jgi:hypothetical protein